MSRARIWSIPGPRSGEVSAHLSIASSREDHVWWEHSSRSIFYSGRLCDQSINWDLAGVNGRLVVHMCQMASTSLRATSTRATFLPRCLPSRATVRS